MFKASLQRHAQLGNVARRRIAAFALRPSRSQSLVISAPRLSQTAIRSNTLGQVIPRFYSAESAAVREDGDSASRSGRVTRFSELRNLGVDEMIVEALTEGMGYETMTDVQSLTINPAMKGVDLVAQAKTGTGKTLAFLIPVFQRIINAQPELARRGGYHNASSEDIRAIILSPTRELAEQIGVEAKKLARGTSVVVQTAVGGTRKREAMYNMQRNGCHILVATPGRLQDILSDPDARVAAPNLQALVLDEADRMLDVGFSDAIREILDLLPPVQQVDRQTLLFSATIPRDVVHLAKSMVKTNNFEFVQTISPDDTPTHEKVPQHVVAVNGYENWFPAILEIANKGIEKASQDPSALPFKAIVFFSNTATVEYANQVFRRTSLGNRRFGIPILDIHSKLTQHARTRNADAFRRAKSGILLSSDVTARGMDFPGVSHVIQVGLPPDRDQYIHRVGRTGRAGNSGEGWLILAEDEIREARARLSGLPIQPNNSLETAKHVPGQDQAPQEVARHFEEISHGYEAAPRRMFRAVYNALLGQKMGRHLRIEDLIRLMNGWSSKGLGWQEPPAVPPRVAANRNLKGVPGVRIGHDQDDDEPRDFASLGGSRSGFQSGPRSDSRGGFQSGSRGGFQSGSRGGFQSGSRGNFQSGSRGSFQSGSRGGFQSGGPRRSGRPSEDPFAPRFGRRDDGRGDRRSRNDTRPSF